MYTRLHIKYPLFLSDVNETWIFSADFRKKKKYSNIKFYGNPPIRSRVVPCEYTYIVTVQGRRQSEGQEDLGPFGTPRLTVIVKFYTGRGSYLPYPNFVVPLAMSRVQRFGHWLRRTCNSHLHDFNLGLRWFIYRNYRTISNVVIPIAYDGNMRWPHICIPVNTKMPPMKGTIP